MQRTVVSYRVSLKAAKQLDEMSTILKTTKAETLEQIIDEAYDKLMGNPKLKEALVKLHKINEMLTELDTELKQ